MTALFEEETETVVGPRACVELTVLINLLVLFVKQFQELLLFGPVHPALVGLLVVGLGSVSKDVLF